MPMQATDDRSDAMVARLEGELEERNAFIQGTIAAAQDQDRDLTDSESELIRSAEGRVKIIDGQLDTLRNSQETTRKARERAAKVNRELAKMRLEVDQAPSEYKTAGEYILDCYKSYRGDREASEKLSNFSLSRAAAHQTTPDTPGTVPDPIVGNVINFIDAARPIVAATGPQAIPSEKWYRPKVSQHTAVGLQGKDGLPADQKKELASQQMKIDRLPVEALTYGGYVNVARQAIDWSNPSALDLVVNDLASQYAIETEAAAAAMLATTSTSSLDLPTTGVSSDDVAAALWEAVAQVYSATKGQGRVVLAVAPNRLQQFGPLFAPVNPQNAQSTGLSAVNFGQGVMGSVSGVQVLMSAGLAPDEAFVYSTAAYEVFEQRGGTLQAVEPSVMGVQVAYYGYFGSLLVEDGGVVPLGTAGS